MNSLLPALIHVKGDDFKRAVNEYLSALKKAKKSIDVSHLPAPGRLTTDQGICLNQAFSYIEASVALIDKAEENFKTVVSGSSGGKKSK